MVGPSHSQALEPHHKSTLKFLCSYGGKILPRYHDGKLRYHGGHTRVLAVPRSIPFSELLVKLGELCGSTLTHFRCQLPTEDLDDALVSITSDEDLANLIDEYDGAASASFKIRAFLSPPKDSSTFSSSSSSSSSSYSSSSGGGGCSGLRHTVVPPVLEHRVHQMSPLMAYPSGMKKSAGLPCYAYLGHRQSQGNPGFIYLIYGAKYWQ